MWVFCLKALNGDIVGAGFKVLAKIHGNSKYLQRESFIINDFGHREHPHDQGKYFIKH